MALQFFESLERPTGVLKAVFLPGEMAPGIVGSPECPTGVLKGFFLEKGPPDFLESLNV